MDSIMLLLDEMEGYLQECNNLPFSSKVVVNMEVLYEFMADLRMKLPEEIKRSKRVIDEKDKIIGEAEKVANGIIEEAKDQAAKKLNEHEIRRQAIKEAETMLAQTKQTADEITESAYEYVDSILAQSQDVIKNILKHSEDQFATYDQYMREQIDVIHSNRNELKRTD